MALIAAEANHPGIQRLQGTNTGVRNVRIHNTSSGGVTLLSESFDMVWIFRIPTAGGAASMVRVGFLDPALSTPTDGAYLQRNETSGNWDTVTMAGSVATTNPGTVAAALDTWFTLRIRRLDASTIRFTINGAESDHSTDIPTVALNLALTFNVATVQWHVDSDYTSLCWTGLSR